MGSMSNSNPWSPYNSYNDCSQGICNIYCPQWCYLLFPPPPPSSFFLNDKDDSSSSNNLSPLLITLIGILVSAFVLVSYYTLISKYCHRQQENSSETNRDHHVGGFFSSSATTETTLTGDGLNDSMIKSITVYKYKKGDGLIDGSDCSVCLSEFEENESLRLLPKCNHAFHLPCIDTWLKSHSNCPLCRAFVTGINPTAVADSVVVLQSAAETVEENGHGHHQHRHQTGDSVLEIESRFEPPEEEQQDNTKDENPSPIMRSVSLNIVVSIADVLREIEDEEESAGVGTSQRREEGDSYEHGDGKTAEPTEIETATSQRSGVSNFLVRSLSTGRFIFSRNYRLPN